MESARIAKRAGFGLIATALILGQATAADSSAANAPVYYPAKGQSADQVTKDKTACGTWAKEQTGYDPAAPAQASSGTGSTSSSGGAVKSAAKGAAAGAAVGAIAGDAGKGAAVGAAAGGGAGAVKKRKEKNAQEEAASKQQATADQNLVAYNKAVGACMEGKGYTVK